MPTGRQLAAARALAGLRQAELAAEAKIDASTLNRMEGSGADTVKAMSRNVEAVLNALRRHGVEITENGVEQIGRPKPKR